MWIALVSSAMAVTSPGARAHEIEPGIADITIGEDEVTVVLRWTIEAPLADLDLRGLTNTNDAEGADAYDELRNLDPAALNAELRAKWPRIAANLTLLADGDRLDPAITLVEIPEVGNLELPRPSTIYLAAPLGDGGAEIQFGWSAAYGPLVVRQLGLEDGYAAFLLNGDLSEPFSAEQPGWFARLWARIFGT